MTSEQRDAEVEAELDYLRDTPAHELLANHFFVLAQWAAVHLASSPTDLVGAQLVIDVMTAMLDAGHERLGENLSLYRSALAEIQQVYVRASRNATTAPATPDEV